MGLGVDGYKVLRFGLPGCKDAGLIGFRVEGVGFRVQMFRSLQSLSKLPKLSKPKP